MRVLRFCSVSMLVLIAASHVGVIALAQSCRLEFIDIRNCEKLTAVAPQTVHATHPQCRVAYHGVWEANILRYN